MRFEDVAGECPENYALVKTPIVGCLVDGGVNIKAKRRMRYGSDSCC